MLLVVDHQQNYSCAMGDKIDEVRKFAIKHKGKPCEFNKTINDRKQGRIVGYNTRYGLVIIRTDGTFGWEYFDDYKYDIFTYKRYKIKDYLYYYVELSNIIINEQNVRKLSSKTSKRK